MSALLTPAPAVPVIAPPTHCGRPMVWDVLRASYVCHCGATA